MVIGRDKLIEALNNGQIYISSYPRDGSEKKQKDWIKQYIQPASIDVPLGNWVYAIPPQTNSPGSQTGLTVAARRDIHTDDDAVSLSYFQKYDLTKNPRGLALMPGAMALAHTADEIGIGGTIACQVATRSTTRRWGLDVCGSAGWVDPGFKSKITLEIHNTNSVPVFIRDGVCYAQLIFMNLDTETQELYGGHYNRGDREWVPEMMLPKGL